MRKAMVRAMVRIGLVTISSFTLLAATPSSVVAAMGVAADDGVTLQQQVPGQSGAPLHHIPGNAGTGDASKGESRSSKNSKSKTGDSKSGDSKSGDSNDSGPSNDSVRSNDCTVGNSGQSNDSVADSKDSVATAGSTDDSGQSGSRDSGDTEDGEDKLGPNCATATPTETGTGGTADTSGTITVDTETQGNVTVRTETTTFADGSRIVRIFNNDVLFREVRLSPGAVLGSEQGPVMGQAALGSAMNPNTVAGQQSAADIAMLPATTPASPAAPIGILGASLVAAGAWLLRRSRRA